MASNIVRGLVAAVSGLGAASQCSATVLQNQTLLLKGGWNAIYAEVAPTDTLDRVFANWPVESVGLYEPNSFLTTQQFDTDDETLGLTASPFAMWYRNYPEATTAQKLNAGTVIVYFGTNTVPVATTLTGVPAAPRNRWHVGGSESVFNYVGFSIATGNRVSPSDYMDGFGGIYLASRTFYKISGTDKSKSPNLVRVAASTKVSDGDVLVMNSNIVSDFSGTLMVSPSDGVDFGADDVQRTLTIRNDSTKTRTANIEFLSGVEAKQITMDLTWIKIRDADVARTNATWTSCSTSAIASKTLAPGETWHLQFGLDRKALGDQVRGIPFGGILRITDADGASKLRVDVPLQAQTSGGSAQTRAWPVGLWVADVALDSIIPPNQTVATQTGGTLKLRLPVHIDSKGTVRLLQRVVAAGTTEADGTYDFRLYAGNATIPATDNTVMRISAVCLPTETPVIEASDGSIVSGKISFEFKVAADGATSLLRHPLHPQHDGLRWDFTTKSPDGDDIENYKYDVKPETFSVSNKLELSLDMNGGEAAWNPEEEKNGTVRWTFSGLRHEGAITLAGNMTIKRVSPKPELVLE